MFRECRYILSPQYLMVSSSTLKNYTWCMCAFQSMESTHTYILHHIIIWLLSTQRLGNTYKHLSKWYCRALRLEKTARDRFPPCLQTLPCTLIFVLQTVLSSHAGRELSQAALGRASRLGGRLGKTTLTEHCICLSVFCAFAREARDQNLTLLGLCSQPHLIIHIQIISKTTASYWKQHIVKGSQ